MTVVTPAMPRVISSAAIFDAWSSTLPRSITVAFWVSTLTSRPLTRESAASAILVLAVSQASVIGFLSSAPAETAEMVEPSRAAKRVKEKMGLFIGWPFSTF